MTERNRRRCVSAGGHAVLITAAGMLLGSCTGPLDERGADTGPGITGVRYLADDSEADGFLRATAPRQFRFPADHAAHAGFRTEWWYFTGNVFDEASNHYGFELTLFRIELEPETPVRRSTLAANEIWMAHLTVTDTARERFQVAERLSRGAAGIAGVTPAEPNASIGPIVYVEDFSIEFQGQAVRLVAGDSGFAIDLELTGLDRIVPQGDNGLDAKGPEPGNASYYFSAPRLRVQGSIASATMPAVAVEGTAWMDREWSTSALSPAIAGWDWFALQLADGRDLMFYRLREIGGGTSPYSGGSLVDATGSITRLAAGDVALSVLREWTSPQTRVRYPIAWRLRVPAEDLELEVRPMLDQQELDVSVRYWEGAVEVHGSSGGDDIDGIGYLELAGY